MARASREAVVRRVFATSGCTDEELCAPQLLLNFRIYSEVIDSRIRASTNMGQKIAEEITTPSRRQCIITSDLEEVPIIYLVSKKVPAPQTIHRYVQTTSREVSVKKAKRAVLDHEEVEIGGEHCPLYTELIGMPPAERFPFLHRRWARQGIHLSLKYSEDEDDE